MSSLSFSSQSTPIKRVQRRKRGFFKKFLVILLSLVLLLYVTHTIFYFLVVPKQPTVYEGARKPLNIAHQGGEHLAPSNTIAAFDELYRYGVDVIETDIHMTKDGQLVTIHDATVDRTTNGTGRVDQFTLEELQKLDAGYHFVDLNGNNSYRGKGVYIPTLEELFIRYGKDYYYNIEIKDRYPQVGNSEIERKLWELIEKYDLQKYVVVSAFDNELIQRFDEYAQGAVALGAGRAEAKRFVIWNLIYLPAFYFPKAQALQLPLEDSGIDLTQKRYFKGAKRLNMMMQYWTINDKETMRRLIELGADGIMTDRPDILNELLVEMGLR